MQDGRLGTFWDDRVFERSAQGIECGCTRCCSSESIVVSAWGSRLHAFKLVVELEVRRDGDKLVAIGGHFED